jgi:hypothetical protein
LLILYGLDNLPSDPSNDTKYLEHSFISPVSISKKFMSSLNRQTPLSLKILPPWLSLWKKTSVNDLSGYLEYSISIK